MILIEAEPKPPTAIEVGGKAILYLIVAFGLAFGVVGYTFDAIRAAGG